MKTELVLSLVFLCVLSVADAAMRSMSGRKSLSSKTETSAPGPLQPRVPRPMRLETFRSEVVGRRYTELYFVELPFDEANQLVKNNKLTWTFLTSTLVERIADGRLSIPPNICVNTRLNITVAPQSRRGPEKAIFNLAAFNLTAWYFSTRPDWYLFEMGCVNHQPTDKICRGDFFVSLLTANDPPNQFPWICAVKELFKQTRLTLLGPNTAFARIGRDCPEPST